MQSDRHALPASLRPTSDTHLSAPDILESLEYAVLLAELDLLKLPVSLRRTFANLLQDQRTTSDALLCLADAAAEAAGFAALRSTYVLHDWQLLIDLLRSAAPFYAHRPISDVKG